MVNYICDCCGKEVPNMGCLWKHPFKNENGDNNTKDLCPSCSKEYDELLEKVTIEFMKGMKEEEKIEFPFFAKVNGDCLDCYGWTNNDSLVILEILDTMDSEHDVYLFKAINLDKEEVGGVLPYQIKRGQ